MNKRSLGETIFECFNVLLMIFLALVTLYPIVFVAFASVSDPISLARSDGLILRPQGFQLYAYKKVFDNPYIIIAYANTIFYMLAGTLCNVAVTSTLAFALSRKKLMLKKLMLALIVFTMFFGGGMIPTYLLMRNLGMMDNRLAVIFPGLVSTMNLIIMRTNFENLPDSLEESAKMDGANDITVFLRIVLPLSIPIIAVMVLFYGVGHWNSWFNAMLYFRRRELYPLQLILREIIILSSTDNMIVDAGATRQELSEVIKYATIMIATIPVLCVYPFLQKYFVKGIMVGAVKG